MKLTRSVSPFAVVLLAGLVALARPDEGEGGVKEKAFDAPNGDFSCVRRTRSNTPLQALTALNEPIFLDCARALALRTITEGGPAEAQRMVYAFRRCLA